MICESSLDDFFFERCAIVLVFYGVNVFLRHLCDGAKISHDVLFFVRSLGERGNDARLVGMGQGCESGAWKIEKIQHLPSVLNFGFFSGSVFSSIGQKNALG